METVNKNTFTFILQHLMSRPTSE